MKKRIARYTGACGLVITFFCFQAAGEGVDMSFMGALEFMTLGLALGAISTALLNYSESDNA